VTVVDRPTHHYDRADRGRVVTGFVLHSTETAVLATPHADGSWHYQIDRDGTVYAEVPEAHIAWGVRDADRWRPDWIDAQGYPNSPVNPCTIHVEFVGNKAHRAAGTPYTAAQYAAVGPLLDGVRSRHGNRPVVGHGQLQLDRTDPPQFDYARAGLVWRGDGYYPAAEVPPVITVPFVSQLEERDTKGWSNCGPACLTMQLAWAGALGPTVEPEELHRIADYVRDGYFDGDHWLNTYTDYPLMQSLAAFEYKLRTRVLYNWADVYKTLDAGTPVQILLYDALLQPRQYPTGPGWDANHFIVLTQYDGDTFRVNDPLAYYHRGPGYYHATSVWNAVAKVGGVYALVVESATHESEEDLRVIEELNAKLAELVSTNSALDDMVTALREEVAGQNGLAIEREGQIVDLRGEIEGLTVYAQELAAEIAALKAVPQEVAPAYLTVHMPSGASYTFDDPVR
jgi:hypothetical protein